MILKAIAPQVKKRYTYLIFPNTHMDRKALRTMIDKSFLLTAEERAYWLRNLPLLDDAQCKKLQGILTVPDDVPFQKEVENYLNLIGRAAQGMQPQHA